MKTIKFRAWIKNKKAMAEVYTLGMTGVEYTTVCVNKELFSGVGADDMELMQWTGLLDKNGKEIYEGDVIINPYIISLKCPHCDKPYSENKPEVVKWDRHHSRWSVPMIDMGQNYRILGNIWENPELLD